MSTVDVHLTIGAALAGCMVAVGLSAVLGFQTFLYFRIFPEDSTRYKFLVAWIWLVDSAHTVLICAGVWHYAIDNFGNQASTAVIYPCVVLPPSFYPREVPILILMSGLSGFAISAGPPLLLPSLMSSGVIFHEHQDSVPGSRPRRFTTSLRSPRSARLVFHYREGQQSTVGLNLQFIRIRIYRTGYRVLPLVFPTEHTPGILDAVDAVMVFTVNDGIMTCAVIVIAATCFLTMPHYWIFTAVFFSIAKMSGNSLLATLNLRNWYRQKHVEPRAMTIPMKPRGQFSDAHYPSLSTDKQAPSANMMDLKQASPSDMTDLNDRHSSQSALAF
ncbi:hypothetical protein C8J57DRAFT_1480102 [Mycena rebaudengoi]|nr:hypothetical protein C8J57DRAFT_1480102 [Mycena rebaudengoi]